MKVLLCLLLWLSGCVYIETPGASCQEVTAQRNAKLMCGAVDLGEIELTGTILEVSLDGHFNGDAKINILPDDLSLIYYKGRYQTPDPHHPRIQLGVWTCSRAALNPTIQNLMVGMRVRARGRLFFDAVCPYCSDDDKAIQCVLTISSGLVPDLSIGFMELYPTTQIEIID